MHAHASNVLADAVRAVGGASQADHNAMLERAGMERPLEPPLPLRLAHVWQAWCELSRRRGSNAFGPAPLTLAELSAYEQRFGLRLSPGDSRAFFMVDDVYLSAYSEERAKESRRDRSRPAAARRR